MAITVFGSINIDITAFSERLPRPGETLHGKSYAIALGGKGCNQAIAATRLGADAKLVGRVGADGFGAQALSMIEGFGADISGIHTDDVETGIAIIGVDAKAENSITVIGGANMAVDHSDIQRELPAFEHSGILMLQLEIPQDACIAAARTMQASGGKVIFDPAPAPKEGLRAELLQHIDIITPNETETQIITGFKPTNETEAAHAATLLQDRGIKAAIVKLGANGVFYRGFGEEGFITPFKVDSIDSVAAGDCFNGGLAYALDQGMGFGAAVRFAAACGALATTKQGAAQAAPTLDEVNALIG